jgi:inorganic triphosphatase YgiF
METDDRPMHDRIPPTAPAHTAPRPRELEIKLRLPPGTETAIETHPALHAPGVAVETREESTTYFDTPDRDLARRGASLRVRRTGTRRVQTLKLRDGADGPFGRGEWEWEWAVDGDGPDLGRLAATPAASQLGALHRLEPVFATEVSRSVRTLRPDGAVIEVAFDRGSVRAGEAVEEICELELELKDGEAGALYRLAAALHANVPFTLGTESKADRGWRLRTGRPRAPAKQTDLPLPQDVSAAEAFHRITGATLANLLANQPAAAAGEVEGIHHMRVAIRRLRATLALFRPHLERHAEACITAELRRLGQILGEARDWDVFCTETLQAAEEGVAGPWLDLLRGPADAERRAAHARMAIEFQGPALTATVLGLAAWAEDAVTLTGAPDGGAMREALSDLAPALEARLERKVLRLGRHIRKRGDEELHSLRKALKKLRYGVEFLAPLHKRKQVKAYLHACKALQEQLGTINDAAVAVDLAERFSGGRHAELVPAVAELAAWAEARRTEARHRLPDAWRAFKAVSLPR